MCGIVGISLRRNANADATVLARRAVAELLHRGPDGSGMVADAASAIAMSRLRVRSRAEDTVPFVGSDPRGEAYAFNGEVYVASVAGTHVPEGGYDEALAVARSSSHGDLDAMYALVARAPDGSLLIARDDLGIKPLYQRTSAEGVAYASEVKCLLDVFGPAPARPEAVFQLLLLGRVVDGGTLYEDITEVPPGARLAVRNGRVFPLPPLPSTDVRPAPTSPDALRAAVSEAINRVLVSNRQIGIAVSGGLDSTIIALELAHAGVADVRTVSVVVDGTNDGVHSLAPLRLPGRAWRSWEHEATVFWPDDLIDGIGDAVDVLGEPSALSSMPLYACLARRARESEIVVLLVGEGADELFGGYRSYLAIPNAASALEFFLPEARQRIVAQLLDPAALASAREALVDALPVASGDGVPVPATIRNFEYEHSLRPLLRRTDHALMQEGIEGRTPFLHGSLPRIARGLPLGDFIGNGQTKPALRAAYARELPQFLHEAKRPFRAPLATWLAGPLLDRTTRHLHAHVDLLEKAGVSADGVVHVIRNLPDGDEETARAAYSLVSLAEWLMWRDSKRASPEAAITV